MKEARSELSERLKSTKLFPNEKTQNQILALGSTKLLKDVTAEEFLRRPEVDIETLRALGIEVDADPRVTEPIEIEVKYSGYVRRQLELIEHLKRWEKHQIPEG